MLYEELKTRRNLILTENDKFKYILYPLNKEELREIEEDVEYMAMGIGFIDEQTEQKRCDFIKDINMCGHIDEIRELHCKDLIPLTTIKIIRPTERFEKRETLLGYKCYCSNELHEERRKYNNVVVHEDKLGSFRCACGKIQTKNFVVIKERIHPIKLEGGIMTSMDEMNPVHVTITNKLLANTIKDVLYGSIDYKKENNGNIQS